MRTGTSVAVTPGESHNYHHCGYLVRPAAFTPMELAEVSASLDALIGDLEFRFSSVPRQRGSYALQYERSAGVTLKWAAPSGGLSGVEPFRHLSPELARLAADPRLAGPATALLDADEVDLYTEKVNLKPARIGNEITLHQDYPYWSDCCENAGEVLSAILFLDEARVDNGCLELLPGSQLRGLWPCKPDTGDGMNSCELDDTAFDRSAMVPIEVPAGSIVFFGSLMVHASAPNHSDTGRRALLYSYQPAGRKRLTELIDPSWYE